MCLCNGSHFIAIVKLSNCYIKYDGMCNVQCSILPLDISEAETRRQQSNFNCNYIVYEVTAGEISTGLAVKFGATVSTVTSTDAETLAAGESVTTSGDAKPTALANVESVATTAPNDNKESDISFRVWRMAGLRRKCRGCRRYVLRDQPTLMVVVDSKEVFMHTTWQCIHDRLVFHCKSDDVLQAFCCTRLETENEEVLQTQSTLRQLSS
jgi:hypothetical protein